MTSNRQNQIANEKLKQELSNCIYAIESAKKHLPTADLKLVLTNIMAQIGKAFNYNQDTMKVFLNEEGNENLKKAINQNIKYIRDTFPEEHKSILPRMPYKFKKTDQSSSFNMFEKVYKPVMGIAMTIGLFTPVGMAWGAGIGLAACASVMTAKSLKDNCCPANKPKK